MRIPGFISKSVFFVSSLVATGGLTTGSHADCSCTGMTVHHALGGAASVCSNANFPDFVKKGGECVQTPGTVPNGCNGFTYHYACKTNVNTQVLKAAEPTQKTGFGIDATVTGTPNDCRFGHSLQQQIMGNGTVQANSKLHDNPPAGNVTVGAWQATIETAPPAGSMPTIDAKTPTGVQKFGADNYSNATTVDYLVQAGNGRIRWWDNPDQIKDNDAENASWIFRYFSFVNGQGHGAQSCGCVFRIAVQWKSKSAPTTTYALDPASPPSCTF